jgi:hypothetical protein
VRALGFPWRREDFYSRRGSVAFISSVKKAAEDRAMAAEPRSCFLCERKTMTPGSLETVSSQILTGPRSSLVRWAVAHRSIFFFQLSSFSILISS